MSEVNKLMKTLQTKDDAIAEDLRKRLLRGETEITVKIAAGYIRCTEEFLRGAILTGKVGFGIASRGKDAKGFTIRIPIPLFAKWWFQYDNTKEQIQLAGSF